MKDTAALGSSKGGRRWRWCSITLKVTIHHTLIGLEGGSSRGRLGMYLNRNSRRWLEIRPCS